MRRTPHHQDRTCRTARRGGAGAWLLVGLATAIVAALVVVFVRNLPAPPRFDDLRIEPGSTTPVMRGIVRRVHGGDGTDPAVSAVNAVEIDDWPTTNDGGSATLVVHRIPVERRETTFVVIGVEGRDVEIVVRRGRSVVLRAGESAQLGERFTVESDSIILPDGASDLEVEMRPTGPSAAARLWWRELDGEDENARRPIAELLEETAGE